MSKTTKATHTPGPWYWSDGPWHGGHSGLYSENGMPVVVPQHENDGDDGAAWFNTDGDAGDESLTDANARLIAAAPDLLEALEDAQGLVAAWACHYAIEHELTKTCGPGPEEWHPTHREIFTKVRAAISKARGNSND